MPQHYTVPTKNAFAVLDDSDTEDRILSKPEVTNVAEVNPPTSKAATTSRSLPKDEDRPHRPSRQQNNTSGQQRDRVPRRPRSNNVDGPAAAGDEAPEGTQPRRTGPVERRGNRRSSNPDRYVPPGKREFDRHSGTGRGTEIKRSGAGPYNWGTDLDVPYEEKVADVEGSPEANPKEEPAPEVPPVEEGPKTKSYAAYLAEMEEKKRALLPQAKGDVTVTEDPAKLEKEGYSVYTKETASSHRKEQVDSDVEGDRKPRTIHLAEIAEQSGVQLHFQNSRGSNRGRGRGGDRPGRGGSKEGSHQQQPQQSSAPRREINLADAAAFPTLQAH